MSSRVDVRTRFHRRLAISIAMAIMLPPFGQDNAIAQSPASHDLTVMSLEDLLDLQVTSVSKKEQPLSKTASAVYVITQDDIQHSGATNVPDLLRIVPGVNVAQIDANTWAISIRGFNYRYSGKVLVLIDGRSVYTPLFSGVYWDQQSTPLEDIDRIEVIRGPGATVWGANAMNGVINIITKKAEDTKGGLVSFQAGSQDRLQALTQYGTAAGSKGAYRVYGQYTDIADSPQLAGRPARDDGHTTQMGFRSDWDLSRRDQLTLQGDLFGASESQTVTTLFSNRRPDTYTFDDKVRIGAGNLLGRWTHEFSNGSEATVQAYYDRSRRLDQGLILMNTGDIDFQYHFRSGTRNDIVIGAGYRSTAQSLTDGYSTTIGSGHRRDDLVSAFVQDEVALSDSLALTVGLKLEHNDYTGYEYEPSVRLAWSPSAHQTVWASASRAIQQPSWVFADAQVNSAAVPVPGVGMAIYQLNGNPQINAPVVFDFELGYRAEVTKRVTIDSTVFFGDYHRLQTVEPETPYFASAPPPPYLILPNVFANLGSAKDYGLEVSGRWDVARWWRISPAFALMRMDVSVDPRSQDVSFRASPGDSPRHQAQLRSAIKIRRNLSWDTSVFYVGALAIGPVPGYTRLDTRLGWHFGESVELSISGQNLLTARHLEFLDAVQIIPTQVGRDIIGKITWHF